MTNQSENSAVPTVSVIIPTYRHRDYVLAALDSVFKQTYSDYEILLINDGSPDDTADVVRSVVEQRGIRYYEKPNGGQANARNFGLQLARGRYIAFLDDDDLWPANKLEWQVAALEGAPDAVMVYGGMRLVGSSEDAALDPGPGAPEGNVTDSFLRRCRIWSPGQTVIRTDHLKAIGGLDESPLIQGADDWDMYIRLSKRGEVVYRNELALMYRTHDSNASQDAIRMYQVQVRVFHKHLGIAPWREPAVRREFRGATGAYCLRVLDQALARRRSGRKLGALAAALYAVRIAPTLLRERHFWVHRAWPLVTGKGW